MFCYSFLKNLSTLIIFSILSSLAIAQSRLFVPSFVEDATACKVQVVNNTTTSIFDRSTGRLIPPGLSIIYHSTDPNICNPTRTSYVVDTATLDVLHGHDLVVYTIGGSLTAHTACTTPANSCKFSDGHFGYLTTFGTGHIYCVACPPL